MLTNVMTYQDWMFDVCAELGWPGSRVRALVEDFYLFDEYDRGLDPVQAGRMVRHRALFDQIDARLDAAMEDGGPLEDTL